MELVNEQPVKAGKKRKDSKVAVLSSPKEVTYAPYEFRNLQENEILVKMEGCGICASNIPVWEGRPWFEYPLQAGAPGHEGWGIVEETEANVTNIMKGQRVSILAGDAFANHVICDKSKAVVLPETLGNAPFPGEPVGCAMNVYSRSDIRKGQTVAVLGVGFLGSILIQLAKNEGAHVIAVSRRESSLKLARDMGADACFNWDEKDEIWDHLKKNSVKGCERVIECVGNQKALDLATELISERGKLIVAGYHQEDLRHINMQVWNWKGIDVINAHERDEKIYIDGIKQAIQAIENGDIEISQLLTHKYAFGQLKEGLETLTEYPEGFTKAYIDFNDGNNS